MKYVAWDPDKNEWLKMARGISFEDVVNAIIDDKVLGRMSHPNQSRHPKQQIFILAIHDYAYVVPFIEDDEKIFFKTIFPSRKYTKTHIEKREV